MAKSKTKPISKMTIGEMIDDIGKQFDAIFYDEVQWVVWKRKRSPTEGIVDQKFVSNTKRGAVSKALRAVRKERAKK